jgi:D-glycero-D-manno-heptose 1,7-bisphosphate phosphatase
MHEVLRRALPLDRVQVCYHDDADGCACRKPEPGMILQAAADLGLDLEHSYMVGDRWRDMEAGHRAGTTTVLIEYGYPEEPPGEPAARVRSLREAADWILAREKKVPA